MEHALRGSFFKGRVFCGTTRTGTIIVSKGRTTPSGTFSVSKEHALRGSFWKGRSGTFRVSGFLQAKSTLSVLYGEGNSYSASSPSTHP